MVDDELLSLLIDKGVKRLASFGYELQTEKELLKFSITNTINSIVQCYNIHNITEDIHNIITDRAVGEFLFISRSARGIKTEGEEEPVKQVSIGDVSVTFKDGETTEGERLKALIEELRRRGEEELLCYRRLHW